MLIDVLLQAVGISIHAAREGGDESKRGDTHDKHHFNPRRP